MERVANLYESTNGNVVDAYLLLKSQGGNIPESWIDRSKKSRMNRQKAMTKGLREQKLKIVADLRDWELSFKKEMFYYGIRVLMDLERKGKTKL